MAVMCSTAIRPIATARDALRSGRIVIVGGDRRDNCLRRLHTELQLSDVVHCPTRKNDASCNRFVAQLHQPDVLLVVWILGLSRTHHGEHLHRLCRTLGIPWVDCFRIPHPNALLACVEKLRLVDELCRRRASLNLCATKAVVLSGGAA